MNKWWIAGGGGLAVVTTFLILTLHGNVIVGEGGLPFEICRNETAFRTVYFEDVCYNYHEVCSNETFICNWQNDSYTCSDSYVESYQVCAEVIGYFYQVGGVNKTFLFGEGYKCVICPSEYERMVCYSTSDGFALNLDDKWACECKSGTTCAVLNLTTGQRIPVLESDQKLEVLI